MRGEGEKDCHVTEAPGQIQDEDGEITQSVSLNPKAIVTLQCCRSSETLFVILGNANNPDLS